MNTLIILTREFSMLLSNLINLEPKQEIELGARQSNVNFQISNDELNKSLDDVAERILLPFALVDHLKLNNARYCYFLTISDHQRSNYEFTTVMFNGCYIRGIIDRNFEYIDENNNSIITNMIRFDIVYS